MGGPRRAGAFVARLAALAALGALAGAGCGGSAGGDGAITGASVVGAVASVALSPTTIALEVGGATTLQAQALDAAGHPLAGQPIVWTSSDTTIVRVTADGRAVGVAPGVAEVAANAAGKFAKASVTVAARAVATVELTPAAPRVVVGARQQLVARTLATDGSELAGRVVTWATSDPAVATVDGAGLVEGRSAGVATVSATSEGRTASVAVTVVAVPVASVVIAPATDTIVVGQSTQLTATARDASGATLADRAPAWSSSDATIASVSSSGLVVGAAEGAVDVSASIDGVTQAARVVVRPRPVGAVIVSPAASTLAVGDTLALSVQLTDATGAPVPGAPVSFATSDAAVAAVSAGGVVTAAAAGTARITATSGGQSGTATIVVTPAVAASIDVQPSSATLRVGQSLQLSAVPRDRAGAALAGKTVTWTTGAPGIATVTAGGRVTATGAGTAVLLAAVDRAVATVTITVQPAAVAAVRLTPAAASMLVGDLRDFTAIPVDSAGAEVAGAVVAFASSNDRVAIVSSGGRVQATGIGTAQITASSGGASASAMVTVLPEPVVAVTVGGVPSSMAPGATASLTATARDRYGAVVTGRAVAWSTSDASVATVSAAGVLTAVGAGTATVSALVDGITGSATVTVATAPAPAPPPPPPPPPTVATVSVTLAASTLTVGQTTAATATTRDAGGTVLAGQPVAWSTSNAAVATVSASGAVTAVGVGSATITATSGGQSGGASLTVTAASPPPPPPPPAPVATVDVSLGTSSLAPGQTTTATATPRDAAGNALTGRSIAWSSSDPSVATVSASGTVTAVAPGTASIVATSGGQSGAAALTVTAPPPPPPPPTVASVSVSLGASSLTVGQTTTATATTRDAGGAVLTGQPIAWSTSNAAVATVSSTGVVTAVGVGSATISATSGAQTGSASLGVVAPPPAPVASVSVALGASSLTVGQTTTATATVRDASGNVLSGRSVAWSSSDPRVATVSASGAVTAVGAGAATITATSGGQSGSASLGVTAPAPTVVRVDVAPGTVNLDLGKPSRTTDALVAVAYDANGRIVPTAQFTWSIADPTIASLASVGGLGVATVTAVSPGSTTVTVSVGGVSATAKVRVK